MGFLLVNPLTGKWWCIAGCFDRQGDTLPMLQSSLYTLRSVALQAHYQPNLLWEGKQHAFKPSINRIQMPYCSVVVSLFVYQNQQGVTPHLFGRLDICSNPMYSTQFELINSAHSIKRRAARLVSCTRYPR